MDIKEITAPETLPLRHQVLWPDLSVEDCVLADDEDGLHFGGFIEGQLICVASVFEDESTYRLRKFAVLPQMQGKGCGTKMLRHICAALKAKNVQTLWFDARKTAIPFYKRLGFEQKGADFYKRDVVYVKMQRMLTFPS